MPAQVKTCTKCGLNKRVSEFYSSGKRYQSHCKSCQKEQAKIWYAIHPDKRREKDSIYTTRNPEKIVAKRKRYARKYPERLIHANDKIHYGVTPEQSDILQKYRLEGQCFCCGATAEDAGWKSKSGKKILHVDHDHESGLIRGVLCAYHNKFEGELKKEMAAGRLKITGWWKEYLENSPGIPGIIQKE